MLIYLVNIIHWAIRIYLIIVIAEVILSYFVSPFHRVRQFTNRLVEPALRPIRKLLPRTGMVDFSPLVLILGLQLIDMLVVGLVQ